MYRGQGPSAVLTLKQFNYNWWDPKLVLRNFSENCKIMIFIIGILSSIIFRVVGKGVRYCRYEKGINILKRNSEGHRSF